MKASSPDPMQILDLRGYRCPIPVVKAETALRDAAPGVSFLIYADDPIAVVDIPHACTQSANYCERLPDRTDTSAAGVSRLFYVFMVTRGENPA